MRIPRMTLIYTYYDAAELLRKQLGNWMTYPKSIRERIEIVIVDDGSQKVSALEVVEDEGGFPLLDLRVYRILVDIPWNSDGARNLAMSECRTLWAFLSDLDHLLPIDQASLMLGMIFRHGEYYLPDQHLVNGESLQRPHPANYIMSRSDFWMLGGYDEDFVGHYGSDMQLHRRAQALGMREIRLSNVHTVSLRSDRKAHDASPELPLAARHNPDLQRKMAGPPYRAENPIRFPYERVI